MRLKGHYSNTAGGIIDCVDRHRLGKIKKIPENVNYIQGSVEDRLKLNKKYDFIFCLEVIEHIDCTDVLLANCYDNLKKDGLLFISAPNLASLYTRLELLMGYQPHLLEMSNEHANYGQGIFGRLNNPMDSPVHHIRGITYRAMKEFLKANKFKINKIKGYDKLNLLGICPRISTSVLYVCSRQ